LTSVPTATYRVQLNGSLNFRDLERLTPYLEALGVSDCYCSPILSARPGSHGYDVCNHGELNPDLGTRDDFQRMAEALRSSGLGLIVDCVPNHMGIDPNTNAWWRDVLENGPSSPFARFFDIDWLPVKADLRNKVLLPILGDQYGVVLERGELVLEYAAGRLFVVYFDRRLPVNPGQAPLVFGHDIERLTDTLGADHDDIRELRSVLSALLSLPAMTQTDDEAVVARQRGKEAARRQLERLTCSSVAVRRHIDRAVAAFNGTPGDRSSFDRLHGLLEVQAYRLAYWRTAFDEINYRRFFDVNDLACLRMEDPVVFAETHALLLELVEQDLITGLRVDHPDGLLDPEAYFKTLRAALGKRREDARDVYLVIEKILGHGERLRESWPVHGTTGYNFLNVLNGVFVHPAGLNALRRAYHRFARFSETPGDTAYASKRFMMRTAMASELNVLSRALNRLSEADRRCRDFTLNGLRRAITEVIACFPVYRTYVSERGASPEDTATVDAAIAEARRRNPVEEPSIFQFMRRALAPAADDSSVRFAQKSQQFTAPVVAKGIEDTAFYRDVLLLSANEVGGDLMHRVRTVRQLHEDSRQRLTQWPLEMTAGSTHDTKRGEDARARINVISELTIDWWTHLQRWSTLNDAARSRVDGLPAPDRNDEWMFYQALIGAWPAEALDAPVPTTAPPELVERMQAFMGKAIREAKRLTSWVHSNEPYEQAVATFVKASLAGDAAGPFLASFVPLQRRVAWFGMLGSLAQLVIRIGSPGVPDIYQGSELWNLSMVDPDNRRPIDFEHRRRLLADLDNLHRAVGGRAGCEQLQELIEGWTDGRIKMYTLVTALKLRRTRSALFLEGRYEPLAAADDSPHVVAFTRRHNGDEVVVMVPRFVATLCQGVAGSLPGTEEWRTVGVRLPSRLANAQMRNLFTGEAVTPSAGSRGARLLAADVFCRWPVAVLEIGRGKS
jgi:(1->4)-alpha-D-glucan 1-alpha-D-glucosylmutase